MTKLKNQRELTQTAEVLGENGGGTDGRGRAEMPDVLTSAST
jgi:hypothetical protein